MKPHDSQRGYFAYYLHEAMKNDPDIWVITPDLGFGMLDKIRQDFPDRFCNTGAAEMSAMGIAVGLALSNKKVFIYSITTFLIYRAYEILRNYVNHEKIPVRLIGGGRDKDYSHDGFSHDSSDALFFLDKNLPNIQRLWPEKKEEIEAMVKQMVEIDKPWFISLTR